MPYNTPPMSALGIQSQQSPYLAHFPRMWYSLYTEDKMLCFLYDFFQQQGQANTPTIKAH